MKLLTLIAVLTALCLKPTPSYSSGGKKEPVILKNKFGWQIDLPSCWLPQGIEGDDEFSSAVVNIWLGNCEQFKSGNWNVQIVSHAHSPIKESRKLYESQIDIAKYNKLTTSESAIDINGSKARVLKSLLPKEMVGWFFAFDCREAVSIMITGKVAAKAIKEVQLPAEIERVMSTMSCTKTKKASSKSKA